MFARYVPYTPGMHVLDLGCGPGNSCRFFHPDGYVGIDTDSSYIVDAKKAFPSHQFHCQDFLTYTEASDGFDLILGVGLLHHIDDETAIRYLQHARTLLKPGGWLLMFDGTIYKGQSRLSRSVVLSDRGRHIRTPVEYTNLAEISGFKCFSTVANNLLLIPHSLMILSAQKQ